MRTFQIIQQLRKAGKRIGVTRLYHYFNELGIKPARRQRPAIYPADTAERILRHLGFAEPLPVAKLPTMRELRGVRAKSRGAK